MEHRPVKERPCRAACGAAGWAKFFELQTCFKLEDDLTSFLAYAAGDPARFSVKDASRTVPFQVIGVGVVLNPGGEVLIDQRLNEGLLGGLWEFPGGK